MQKIDPEMTSTFRVVSPLFFFLVRMSSPQDNMSNNWPQHRYFKWPERKYILIIMMGNQFYSLETVRA